MECRRTGKIATDSCATMCELCTAEKNVVQDFVCVAPEAIDCVIRLLV